MLDCLLFNFKRSFVGPAKVQDLLPVSSQHPLPSSDKITFLQCLDAKVTNLVEGERGFYEHLYLSNGYCCTGTYTHTYILIHFSSSATTYHLGLVRTSVSLTCLHSVCYVNIYLSNGYCCTDTHTYILICVSRSATFNIQGLYVGTPGTVSRRHSLPFVAQRTTSLSHFRIGKNHS